jgi:DNA-binding transcriptional MerR regulator
MGRKKLLDKEEELEQELLRQHHKKDVSIEDFEKAIDKEDSLSVDEVEEKELSSLTTKEEIDVEEAKIVEAKRRKKLRNEVTYKLRFDVLERDQYHCVYCGRSPKTTPGLEVVVDHIIPLEKGGTNDMTNLATSCFECNEGKKARMLAIIGFEREYNLPTEEILRLTDLNNREENKKFFLDDKNNEARLYLYDLYRQKNELRCIKDCKECIVSGKLFFNDCMGRLNQKARYGLDDRRGINDELMRTTQGENIVTAVENRTQCDLCYISRRCPKYKVGAMCYFDFSANADFTDTRMAMKILLNTQKARVLRAAFFETTDGGALDKNLSNEITLLTSMIKINEEMGADKVGINIQATGSGAGVGIVEKILGDIFKNSSNKEEGKSKEVNSDIEDAEVIKE